MLPRSLFRRTPKRSARSGEGANFFRSGVQQRRGTRIQRRAGRAHVVYQHKNKSLNLDARPDGEGAADVGVALRFRQVCLRPCLPRAHERIEDWQAEIPRQRARLVEAARTLARRMERNGNDGVRAGEHLRAGVAHPLGEMARERRTRIVFQGVNDGLQRVFVRSDGRGQLDVRGKTVAAERRGRDEGGPAPRADGAARRFVERRAAGGAVRRQEDGQQAVQATP